MPGSPLFSPNWRWGLLSALAIMFLAMIPQIHHWLVRGSSWNGMYAMQQGDETYYSAYINALIDGRPRRNDPFIGQDDHKMLPMHESLFSIQFVPPYVIAILARALNLSASTAFIVLMGVIGFLSALTVFWLLFSITGDSKAAAVGAVFVLCLGTLAGGQGWIGIILNPEARFSGLLFLRRYLPSAPFPLFFVFCTLVVKSLTTTNRRVAQLSALVGGFALSLLIFSYLYLWTAAVALFVCMACLWLVLRPGHRSWFSRIFLITAIPVMVSLVLYGYLISHLPAALDKVHVLGFTHRPDLLRIPEVIGAVILVALLLGVHRGKLAVSDPQCIFAASFALLPFLVFNQQIITGRSIQPYHYEIFIANYVVLVALVIVVNLFRESSSGRTLILIASSCFLWGAVEVNQPFLTRTIFDSSNDEMVPVLQRLNGLAEVDGTWESLHKEGKTAVLVFSPAYGIPRLLPTWAPQGSLLAPGSAPFQSLPEEEQKERLYCHLYYSGKSKEDFRDVLNGKTEDPYFSYYAKSTIFGPERLLTFLGDDFQPVTQDEIETEARIYDGFVKSFSKYQVLKRPITYLVIVEGGKFDFSRIDKWYERDAGEPIGLYSLYRLKNR